MLTCFLQPLWLWNPSWSHSCTGPVIQTISFILFQVKAFWFWWRSIDIRPIDFALLAHFAFLAHLANRNRRQTKELHIYVCICQGMPLLARPHYYCAKFLTVRCNQTCPSRALRALLFASLKNTLTWDHIVAMRNKMVVRNVFPDHQFRHNMFHSQIGIRKQNSPKWPIWEHCVPFTDRNSEQNIPKSPIWEQYVPFTNGNSEQNGAKCPIVNKLFHSQMGIRNKTVLYDQFGNDLFHWHIETRNKSP